jgi:hypothetical protein
MSESDLQNLKNDPASQEIRDNLRAILARHDNLIDDLLSLSEEQVRASGDSSIIGIWNIGQSNRNMALFELGKMPGSDLKNLKFKIIYWKQL